MSTAQHAWGALVGEARHEVSWRNMPVRNRLMSNIPLRPNIFVPTKQFGLKRLRQKAAAELDRDRIRCSSEFYRDAGAVLGPSEAKLSVLHCISGPTPFLASASLRCLNANRNFIVE